MPQCNSFSTSLQIKFLSSFQKRRDFVVIGLQFGYKFVKSKGLSTEAAERLQIVPGSGITKSAGIYVDSENPVRVSRRYKSSLKV